MRNHIEVVMSSIHTRRFQLGVLWFFFSATPRTAFKLFVYIILSWSTLFYIYFQTLNSQQYVGNLDTASLELFAPFWDQTELDEAAQLMTNVDEILRRKNLNYFMLYETLMGSVKLGSLLPWDSRLSFAVEKGRLSRREFEKLSLELLPFEDRELGYTVRSMDSQVDLKLNLFFYSVEEDIVTVEGYNFPLKEVFPTTRRNIEMGLLSAPHSPEYVLQTIYGSQWKSNCFLQNMDRRYQSCDLLTQTFNYSWIWQVKPSLAIPKIIHQVWLGKLKLPPMELIQSCKDLNPGWVHKLWRDEDMPELQASDAFARMRRYNGKADILRWELLNAFGGNFMNISI